MKNTTGLYKHQRDNQGKRRRLPTMGLPSGARIVLIQPDPECEQCGFGLTTNAHRKFCGSAEPYDAGSPMNRTDTTNVPKEKP